METDTRKNPALLKIDLYCQGLRLDDSCLVEEDGIMVGIQSQAVRFNLKRKLQSAARQASPPALIAAL